MGTETFRSQIPGRQCHERDLAATCGKDAMTLVDFYSGDGRHNV